MSNYETIARTLLGEALGVPADAISADASIDSESQWSSLSHMRLVIDLETHLGVPLEPESMLELVSLRSITALLERFDDHG